MTDQINLDQMKELLRKWRELDPEPSYEIYLTRINDLTEKDLIRPSFLMRIQWSIQQAIIARGWPFSLEWDGEWIAAVADDKYTYSDLDSSIVALLSAYVKALKGPNQKAPTSCQECGEKVPLLKPVGNRRLCEVCWSEE